MTRVGIVWPCDTSRNTETSSVAHEPHSRSWDASDPITQIWRIRDNENSVREQQRRMSWIYVSNNKWVTPERNSPTVPGNHLFIFLPSVCSRNIMSSKCKQSRASGPQCLNEGDVASGISIRIIIRAETINWLRDSSVDRRWFGNGCQNRLNIRVTCDDENDKH